MAGGLPAGDGENCVLWGLMRSCSLHRCEGCGCHLCTTHSCHHDLGVTAPCTPALACQQHIPRPELSLHLGAWTSRTH